MTRVGQILLTARVSSGLTQEELAERTGVTQAALSRYEGNLREPDADTLERLSTALGVTPDLVERGDRIRGAIAAGAHMRRRKTGRVSEWRRIEAHVMMALAHTMKMTDTVHVQPRAEVPSVDPLETSPQEAARLVRMQWRTPLGPIRSLTAWLESAGIFIFEDDFGPDVRVDGMSIVEDGVFVILINASAPTDRKRWTLAHELGHLVMHSTDLPPEQEVEHDADTFAAEFLMPETEIRPQLTGLRTAHLLDLKLEWGVSMAALVERAHSLGLLDPDARRSFYKMMSARGYRKNEPGSDQIAAETPSLPASIVEKLTHRNLTPDDIAALAGFANPGANDLFPTPRVRERLRLVRTGS